MEIEFRRKYKKAHNKNNKYSKGISEIKKNHRNTVSNKEERNYDDNTKSTETITNSELNQPISTFTNNYEVDDLGNDNIELPVVAPTEITNNENTDEPTEIINNKVTDEPAELGNENTVTPVVVPTEIDNELNQLIDSYLNNYEVDDLDNDNIEPPVIAPTEITNNENTEESDELGDENTMTPVVVLPDVTDNENTDEPTELGNDDNEPPVIVPENNNDSENDDEDLSYQQQVQRSRKKIAILSLLFAGLIVVFAACGNLVSKISKKNQNSDTKDSDKEETTYDTLDNIIDETDYVTDSLTEETNIVEDTTIMEETTLVADSVNLNDLGVELEFPKVEDNKVENDKNYGEVSGRVDKNEIVEDNKGTIWKNEEAKDKSKDIGKEVIDDQNGTLTTDAEEKVVEKEPGNEVIHEDGTITTGEGSVPAGYTWDNARGEYVKDEDVGKYIYSDKDFYTSDGELMIMVGDLVTRETYDRACRELLTTKPVSPETTVDNSNNQEETTPNITYTDSHGNAWLSYEDYLKCIENIAGIAQNPDGLLYFNEELARKAASANITQETTAIETEAPKAPETTAPTPETEAPIIPETEAPAPETEAPITSNPDGTYTDEFGNVWESYDVYLQGMENFDEVYDVGGVWHYGKSFILGR